MPLDETQMLTFLIKVTKLSLGDVTASVTVLWVSHMSQIRENMLAHVFAISYFV